MTPDPDPNDAPERFDREQWPFYWLTRVTARYLDRFDRELKRVGLDVSRWRVLACLGEDRAISISELAELAIVKLPTIMKIVQRMQADGLVTLKTRASDGRVTEVVATAAGDEARERALRIARGLYARCFAALGGEAEAQVNEHLRAIFHALDA